MRKEIKDFGEIQTRVLQANLKSKQVESDWTALKRAHLDNEVQKGPADQGKPHHPSLA